MKTWNPVDSKDEHTDIRDLHILHGAVKKMKVFSFLVKQMHNTKLS